jgi:hypothetical protein
VPYLTLMREDAAQRERSIRELFNGLRYVVLRDRAAANTERPAAEVR